MHQCPVLVASFVHVCGKMRAEPDIHPQMLLSSPDVTHVHAIAEAGEFYSYHLLICHKMMSCQSVSGAHQNVCSGCSIASTLPNSQS